MCAAAAQGSYRSFGGAGNLGARLGSAPALCSPESGLAWCQVRLVLAARALSLHLVAVCCWPTLMGWRGLYVQGQAISTLPPAMRARAPYPPRLSWSRRFLVGQAFLILLCYFGHP